MLIVLDISETTFETTHRYVPVSAMSIEEMARFVVLTMVNLGSWFGDTTRLSLGKNDRKGSRDPFRRHLTASMSGILFVSHLRRTGLCITASMVESASGYGLASYMI